jgi:hypothetical protein
MPVLAGRDKFQTEALPAIMPVRASSRSMTGSQRDGGLLAKTEFNGIGGIVSLRRDCADIGTPPCTFGLSSPALRSFLSELCYGSNVKEDHPVA